MRAFRRPLQADETSAFLKLFAEGQSAESFATGVAWVVEAMLQTPEFLYRISIEDQDAPDGLRAPDAWSLASQLSYTLWNSMPDEELFAAAKEGSLLKRSALRAQVMRMLGDRRARDVVGDFHAQFMQVHMFNDLHRDPKLFPAFSSTLTPSMRREVELFASTAVLDDELAFKDFFTAPFTFVDAGLAKLYGTAPPTNTDANGFGRVKLDPSQRGGPLTQIGFLASHAHFDASSPILRGTFLLKHVLCQETPAPPPDVDLTLPMAEPGMTTRELVDRITSGPGCVNCHRMINPPGFAFETFDAAGQWRSMDAKKPVDASGKIELSTGEVTFESPMQMLSAVAKTPEAATCYTENWLSYLLARQLTEDEKCLPEELAHAFDKQNLNIKDLIVEVVTSRSFLYRSETSREQL